MAITPNKQKRQKVLDLLGAFAYLENVGKHTKKPTAQTVHLVFAYMKANAENQKSCFLPTFGKKN